MQTTIINDITGLEFVSDKGLWSPKLSGNDGQDYEYGKNALMTCLYAILKSKSPSMKDEKRLLAFCNSVKGDGAAERGFLDQCRRVVTLIEEDRINN